MTTRAQRARPRKVMALCWLATPGDGRPANTPVTMADIEARGWPFVGEMLLSYVWGIRELPVLIKPGTVEAETRPHANGSNVLIPVTPEMREAEAQAAEKAEADQRARALESARAVLADAETAEAEAVARLEAARGAVETARAELEEAA